ncbi:hypothetical protein BJV74DRAFT_164847 [Russula compacta]|nr:hypothetical protein BJV74DRAFT_164847 [Russula compacta]
MSTILTGHEPLPAHGISHAIILFPGEHGIRQPRAVIPVPLQRLGGFGRQNRDRSTLLTPPWFIPSRASSPAFFAMLECRAYETLILFPEDSSFHSFIQSCDSDVHSTRRQHGSLRLSSLIRAHRPTSPTSLALHPQQYPSRRRFTSLKGS